MGLLNRRKPDPPRAVNRPGPAQTCASTKRNGDACRNWASKGASTCYAHTTSRALVLGEQSNTRGSLVAASTNLSVGGASWKEWQVGNRAWQEEAWRLYDITGQLRFVARSVANSMSLCNLYVTELDEAGNEVGETKDETINSLATKPLGTGPAKAEAVQALGLQLFVSGETYLVSESRSEREGGDLWFVASGSEVRKVGGQVVVYRPPQYGGGELVITDQHMIIRIWTPHPRNQREPDSPVRSAIPDLLELEAIRKREFAELDSRLTGAGIMVLPESVDFPHGDDQPDGAEGFSQQLTEQISTSMQDRASARAMVPYVITVADELVDKIQAPITFWSEMSGELLNLKEAALRSLAQSLDAPVEMMQGAGETNHWSAWLINEDTIKTHYEPPLNRIADALTREYLIPALEFLGYDNPERYAYRFSTAPLRVRADRTADALVLHERGLLSDEALLEAAAFTDEDLPSDDERLRRLATQIIESQPSVGLLDSEVRRLAGFTDEPEPAPAPDPGPIMVDSEVQPQEQRALPEQPTEPPEDAPNGLVAACEISVLRALELAGGRLVPHRERGDTPKHELHTVCRAADTATAEKALDGAWRHLGIISEAYHIPRGDMEELLHAYSRELVMSGVPHSRSLLSGLLKVARHGH